VDWVDRDVDGVDWVDWVDWVEGDVVSAASAPGADSRDPLDCSARVSGHRLAEPRRETRGRRRASPREDPSRNGRAPQEACALVRAWRTGCMVSTCQYKKKDSFRVWTRRMSVRKKKREVHDVLAFSLSSSSSIHRVTWVSGPASLSGDLVVEAQCTRVT